MTPGGGIPDQLSPYNGAIGFRGKRPRTDTSMEEKSSMQGERLLR
jgi:hypothetical protein